MSTWLSYGLSDFLLFAPRVYHRLFVLHNEALWPLPPVALLLGVALAVVLAWPVPGRERGIPALLGVLWLFVVWAFLWQRYATIAWPVVYVTPLMAAQGLALLGVAVTGRGLRWPERGWWRRSPWRVGTALAMLVLAVAGYPLLAPLAGRPWAQAAVFGIAPDPTVVATLACLVVARGPMRWALLPVPLLWCGITGLTLAGLGDPAWWVAPAAALLAVGLMGGGQRRP